MNHYQQLLSEKEGFELSTLGCAATRATSDHNFVFQLETEPNSSFERGVVCEDDEAFLLSSTNVESVERMLRDLKKQKESNIAYAENLRQKIGVLFDKLEVSGKDSFMSAHRGFTKMIIEEVGAFF